MPADTVPGDFFSRAHAVLMECDVARKLAGVRELNQDWDRSCVDLPASAPPALPIGPAGRPSQPELVSAFAVKSGSVHSVEGRARLLHALAHIEFNAVNLALDAAYRFRGLPRDYYSDWLRVAAEEAFHFELLRDYVRSLGYEYGAFQAHNGLWEMAERTAHDLLARMALVPKTLEARGLDANPALVGKLRAAGDTRAVEILEIILRDEIGHVAIGNRWFAHACAQRGLEPLAAFGQLIEQYRPPRLRAPLHVEARRAAGFSDDEIRFLQSKTTVPPG